MIEDQSNISQHDIDPILLKAIDWMVLLESGVATAEDQQHFEMWLNEHISHQTAWQTLQHEIDQPFQTLQQQSLETKLPIKALTQSVLQVNKKPNKHLIKGGISLLLLIGLGSLMGLQQTRPLSFIQADYYTRTAQQKQIQLQDGSYITLAAYSAIKVDFSSTQRNIYLLDGTLIAKVTADQQRPFVVHTKQAQIQALGTEFMVQQHTDYSDTAVLEHTVKASNAHQFKLVEQGQAVRVNEHGIQQLPIKADHLVSWKDGILHVENISLSEFIQLIKPYHQGPIYLSDQVKDIKVYGVFYLDDTDKILQILQNTQPIRVHQHLGLTYLSALNQK